MIPLMSATAFAAKHVWVTGAGQGIGYCIALRFVELGASVVGLDRYFHPEQSYPFAQVNMDVACPVAVSRVCQGLLKDGPGLDVLVNAAGILRVGALDQLALADWHACLEVNLSGVFYILRELLPHFKAKRSGAIVNVASNAAHVPRWDMGAYCASKAGLVSLSHCAALELAAFGVRCNLVSPGSTATPMLREMLGDEAGFARTLSGSLDTYRLGIPLGKIACPDDIANTVVFLASDWAGHITMQDVVVDGGATLAA